MKQPGQAPARRELVRGQDELSPRGGLVRATRRPAGWTAPGPAPHPPDDRSALWPDTEEDLCWLAGDWRLLQRREGHRFSLDDLVTAHYAYTVSCNGDPGRVPNPPREGLGAAKPLLPHATVTRGKGESAGAPDRILDLGCGIGTVLLLMAWRFPTAILRGIEAQPISAALARRSIAWNGVGDRCQVVSGDLRDSAVLAAEPRFPLITGTPPYFPRGTGPESEQIQRGPCRFEHRGGIEDYAAAAARHLAPGAPFVACAAATQTERVVAAAAGAGLAVEALREVVPRAGKAPLIILFSMRAREVAGPMLTEPPLVVRDAAGRRTEEFVRLRADMGMPP